MNLRCEKSHPSIMYETDSCPICPLLEEKDRKIRELETGMRVETLDLAVEENVSTTFSLFGWEEEPHGDEEDLEKG